MIHYRIATQDDLLFLAKLRIEVFFEWPYLYEGNLEYEKEYLKTYLNNSRSRVFLCLDDDKIVGASSCIPLEDETANIQKPFVDNGLPLNEYLYFGESVLLPSYRGKGIGIEFFKLREEYAKYLKKKYTTFCGVIRSDDHLMKPKNYIPLNDFWMKRGYKQASGLVCEIIWKDRQEQFDSPKKLQFWIKNLI